MQARVPRVIRYHAPWNLPDGIEKAALPAEIEGQSQSDQRAAMEDVDAKNLVIHYRSLVARHAPSYYYALNDAYTTLFTALATSASISWGGMFHFVRTLVTPHLLYLTRYIQ
jgi:hypothetical protein